MNRNKYKKADDSGTYYDAEIKRLKKDIELLTKQNGYSKERMEEFISEIKKLAHNINNYVFVITGYCDLLMTKPANREIQKKLYDSQRYGYEFKIIQSLYSGDSSDRVCKRKASQRNNKGSRYPGLLQ
jgi:hypothetical protein